MKRKTFMLFNLLVVSCVLFMPVFAVAHDIAPPEWRPTGDLSGTGYMRADWGSLDHSRVAECFIYDKDSGFLNSPELRAEHIDWEFDIIVDNFVTLNSFKRGRLQITYEVLDGQKTCIQAISSDCKWEKVGRYDSGNGFYTDVYDFFVNPGAESAVINLGWVSDPDCPSDPSNYLDDVILEVLCHP
ncbi:MAG: hypothetical protein SV062_11710 [Thermodesulfobacteriota bacterium]|nr:hypothetical protein [Thermodesulfobacteriota bacterium]